MKINDKGILIVKSFEGCKLIAYLCPAKIWTIGYGHTGTEVKSGLNISLDKANQLLQQDLIKFEDGVNKLVTSSINQNQFSALVSFAYNLGLGALQKSTLLKLVNANPNDHNIPLEFMKWINAGGKPLDGLKRRRAAESELYQKSC
jgi:lysozyme